MRWMGGGRSRVGLGRWYLSMVSLVSLQPRNTILCALDFGPASLFYLLPLAIRLFHTFRAISCSSAVCDVPPHPPLSHCNVLVPIVRNMFTTSGSVMHRSPPNPSDKTRIIYTFHMIEGDGAVYDERNWYVDTLSLLLTLPHLILSITSY